MVRRSIPALGLVVLTLLAVPACTTVTEPATAVGISLAARSAARDTLGFAEIGFQITNAGTTPVYLPRCGTQVAADIQEIRFTATGSAIVSDKVIGCLSSLAIGPYRLEPGQSVGGMQRARLTSGFFRLRVTIGTDAALTNARSVTSDGVTVS